jgi:hypothetical protein
MEINSGGINIGKLIEKEMKRQGVSHGELGRRIFKSRTNVYNILQRREMDTVLLRRISRALKTNFFALYAKEMEKEGCHEPADPTTDMLAFTLQDDEKEFFVDEDINEGYQEIDALDVSLIINGVKYDVTLDMLPEELFPILVYVYGNALENGPLRDMNDEALDENFFPWLAQNHPRLADPIVYAIEEVLTELIADDEDGKYRNHINYYEPSDEDDWFELGDNDIKYHIGNLTERIHKVKRPSSWLLPALDY